MVKIILAPIMVEDDFDLSPGSYNTTIEKVTIGEDGKTKKVKSEKSHFLSDYVDRFGNMDIKRCGKGGKLYCRKNTYRLAGIVYNRNLQED